MFWICISQQHGGLAVQTQHGPLAKQKQLHKESAKEAARDVPPNLTVEPNESCFTCFHMAINLYKLKIFWNYQRTISQRMWTPKAIETSGTTLWSASPFSGTWATVGKVMEGIPICAPSIAKPQNVPWHVRKSSHSSGFENSLTWRHGGYCGHRGHRGRRAKHHGFEAIGLFELLHDGCDHVFSPKCAWAAYTAHTERTPSMPVACSCSLHNVNGSGCYVATVSLSWLAQPWVCSCLLWNHHCTQYTAHASCLWIHLSASCLWLPKSTLNLICD